jgi:hypothetical protein
MEVDLLGIGDAIAAAGVDEVARAAMGVVVADVFGEQERPTTSDTGCLGRRR